MAIRDERLKEKKNLRDNPLLRSSIPIDAEGGFPLLQLTRPSVVMSDLIVKDDLKNRLRYVIDENYYSKKLYAIGMGPKQKILFCGPPGTGKTFASKVMSSTIGYPLVYVLFDSIVSSLLGETSSNLRKIFEFIEKGKYVVLFDEFDIVGKRRDDPNEHGEIKRVVNNFMQMLDTYNGESIIIAATNHPQILDTAIWRRFDEILYFDLPDYKLRKELFKKYLSYINNVENYNEGSLSTQCRGYSAADVAQICEDAIRRGIISDRNYITNEDLKWALSEQKRRKKTMQDAIN